jgi:hypothetical protein
MASGLTFAPPGVAWRGGRVTPQWLWPPWPWASVAPRPEIVSRAGGAARRPVRRAPASSWNGARGLYGSVELYGPAPGDSLDARHRVQGRRATPEVSRSWNPRGTQTTMSTS